jgi:hypothetical protein
MTRVGAHRLERRMLLGVVDRPHVELAAAPWTARTQRRRDQPWCAITASHAPVAMWPAAARAGGGA